MTNAQINRTPPQDAWRPYPVFRRQPDGRMLGGVATGLAAYFGWNLTIVRWVLVVLSGVGGLGLLVYAVLWMFTPLAAAAPKRQQFGAQPRQQYLLIALAAVLGVSALSFLTGFKLLPTVALLLGGTGVMAAWFAMDKGVATLRSRGGVIVAAGALLVLSGVIVLVVRWESTRALTSALAAVLLTLGGIGALAVPLWLRLWEALTTAQREEAAANERAEIASRLHDSVLQTLALIQKSADNPPEVRRLARGQERQLRNWLFSDSAKPLTAESIFAALELACGEVEDLYGVEMKLVTVGADVPMADRLLSLVMAAREAMVNAAKHAGVSSVDVYAESLAGTVEVFVRDRGVGFDPEAIPADRHGVRDSIRARVERAGGRVSIHSAPGRGTEVHVSLGDVPAA